jgi:hypothetical protein
MTMIKNFTLLTVLLFASVFGFTQPRSNGTNYQTIDNGGGNIGWSTDGGVTDCGCTPDYEQKDDSIKVFHPYTFTSGFLAGDLNAYLEINTNVATPVVFDEFINKRESGFVIENSTVLFNDGIFTRLKKTAVYISNSNLTFNGSYKLDETTAWVSGGAIITFNSTCEVFGKKNAKSGNLFISGNSNVSFNGNVSGDIKGDGQISFGESTCTFANSIIISEVKLFIEPLAVMTVNNGVTIDKSQINVANNSSIFMLNNITIIESNLTANTPNLVLGTGAIFKDNTVLDFGANVNGFFWGSISFDNVEILLRSGSVMGFLSGVTIEHGKIDIEDGAIAEFDSANIDDVNLSISGLLKGNLSTIITNSDIDFSSTGIMDLTLSTHCDFTKSKVNKDDASDILTCGQTYNPDENDYKIWEAGTWSGNGNPPNNVGIYVEIKDNYSTSVNGNILCGHLQIEDSLIINIDSLGYIHATQTFNNRGFVFVKNEGSLLMNDGINYWENNGSITVEVLGPLSNMQYNIWSTPVRDTLGILSDFPNTNPCDIYAYDGASQTWKYDYEEYTDIYCGIPPNDTHLVTISAADIIPGANGLMEKGRGYYIPGNNQSDTRFFTGKVNTGPITMFIKTTDLGSNPNWDNDDWNLVGNPYPSGLDLNSFWARNVSTQNALTDGIYFWIDSKEPPYDQYGSYLVWNYSGGTYQPYSQNKTEISVIPAGKGFWVLANDPNNNGLPAYDLAFNNSMRTSLSGSSFSSKYVSTRYEYSGREHQKLWIVLSNDSNKYDQILIANHPKATDSIDVLFDAHKNYGGEPLALAMINNSQAFTIQGFAPRIAIDTSEIELTILASNLSNHYLTIDSSDYYLTEKRVFLLDKLKGTEQEMLLGQPLTLDIDSAGRYANRFYLKTTNSHITAVTEVENGLDGRIWSNESIVYYDSFENNIAAICVYDLRGVQVYHSTPNNRNSQFTVGNITEGVFIIRFTDSLGNNRTERVHLK